jgi:DNA-directed RNA polymerase subunit RPC12/RpoP
MLRGSQASDFAKGQQTVTRYAKEKHDYGRSGRAQCSNCGGRTRVKSRVTHPDHGPTYELQTFECPKCGTIDTRSVHTPDAATDGS